VKCSPVIINQLKHLVYVPSFFNIRVGTVVWLARVVEFEYPLTDLNNVSTE
jgi:hypothetical protein